MMFAKDLKKILKKVDDDLPILMQIRTPDDSDITAVHFEVSYINEPGHTPHILIQGYDLQGVD